MHFTLKTLVKNLSILITFFSANCLAEPVTVQKFPLLFRPESKPGLLIKIEIQNQSLVFLVDTGASAHSLNERLADKLKLKQVGDLSGDTPYGSIRLSKLGDVEAKIADQPVSLLDSLTVKDEPGGLDQEGILGTLSPPRLAEKALVVVDAAEPALYIVRPVPNNIEKWLAGRHVDESIFAVQGLGATSRSC